MSLKYKFTRATLDIIPSGEVTAQVYFDIRDDGNAMKTEDHVQFSVAFPITKDAFKSQAEAAIVTKYSGATKE